MLLCGRWAKRIGGAVLVLKWFAQGRSGVTTVEYAMIAAFIAIVAYGGASLYGARLGFAWDEIGTAVPN